MANWKSWLRSREDEAAPGPNESSSEALPVESRTNDDLGSLSAINHAGYSSANVTSPFDEPLTIGEGSARFEPKFIDGRYRGVPYSADTIVDGWATETFTIRGASVRGRMHRYSGAPRQDDLALAYVPAQRKILVAVADGISSANQAHIGAAIAVRFAVQWLNNCVETPAQHIDWNSLFRQTAWQLVEHAKRIFELDAPDPVLAQNELATTLLCAVIEESTGDLDPVAHIAGLGDSGAWLVADGVMRPVYGGKGEPGSLIADSTVTGLPRVPTATSATQLPLPPGCVLLLGTDGFGDPIGSGGGELGSLFIHRLQTSPSLLAFVHLLDFSRETFDDDRTLVALWPEHRIVKPTTN